MVANLLGIEVVEATERIQLGMIMKVLLQMFFYLQLNTHSYCPLLRNVVHKNVVHFYLLLSNKYISKVVAQSTQAFDEDEFESKSNGDGNSASESSGDDNEPAVTEVSNPILNQLCYLFCPPFLFSIHHFQDKSNIILQGNESSTSHVLDAKQFSIPNDHDQPS